MKFQYLGTAAAEGWPAMFCACDACKRAAEAGGRNLRTRSQAVIDDKLLIDFPADTCTHAIFGGLNLSQIHSCIITHSHSDHLYAPDFEMRRADFTTLEEEIPLTVYGAKASGNDILPIIKMYQLDDQNRVQYVEITPFVPFETEGYQITPLKANHGTETDPVLFLIGDGNKTILYANDTGLFPEETWEWLKQNRPHLDFVSLDCTGGINGRDWRNGHMGFDTNLETAGRMKEIGITDESTLFCMHHFSHNGGAIYDELVPIAARENFLVSYDGMVLEI